MGFDYNLDTQLLVILDAAGEEPFGMTMMSLDVTTASGSGLQRESDLRRRLWSILAGYFSGCDESAEDNVNHSLTWQGDLLRTSINKRRSGCSGLVTATTTFFYRSGETVYWNNDSVSIRCINITLMGC